MTTTHDIVAKLWNMCNVLKDDGVTYHQYVTELTYLLFLKMADEQGIDYKVLCVALADPMYAHLEALRQVSPHKLREIEQFFHTYKNLEDKSVEIDGWAGVAETLEILRHDRERWLEEQTAAEDGAER